MRLFNRTTRSVALTEAGERLYARLKPAFRDIDDAVEDLNTFRDAPIGTLRLNASLPSARPVLLPIMSRFIAAFPASVSRSRRIQPSSTSSLRASMPALRFGEIIAADIVAVPIGPRQRSAVVATPNFSSAMASPRHRRIC